MGDVQMTPEEWTVGVAVKPPDKDFCRSKTAAPRPSSIPLRRVQRGPNLRRGLYDIV